MKRAGICPTVPPRHNAAWHFVANPGAWVDHWCGRRRPLRDLHILGCRRGIRLFRALDRHLFVPTHGGGAVDVCTTWYGDRAGTWRCDPIAISLLGALVVAALRDHDRNRARDLLAGLAIEFPGNSLYAQELTGLELQR